jgi:hypothetical protein
MSELAPEPPPGVSPINCAIFCHQVSTAIATINGRFDAMEKLARAVWGLFLVSVLALLGAIYWAGQITSKTDEREKDVGALTTRIEKIEETLHLR